MYHISDKKRHESAYTTLVTGDLSEHFDDVRDSTILRIKNDN